MTLRTRLLVAQLPIAAALVGIGLLATLTVADLGRAGRDILSANYRSVLAAQRMKEALERIDSATLFVVAGERDKGAAQLKAQRPIFERELQVQERNLTERGEGDATRGLREKGARYFAEVDALATAADPRRHYLEALEPAFLDVKAAADVILSMNQDTMVHKSERMRLESRRANTVTVVGVILSLLAGLGLSLNLTARALRPLGVLRQAVRRLGDGDLTARAAVQGSSDVTELAGDFNAMAVRLQAFQQSSLGELLQAQQSSQAAIDSLPDPVLVFGRAGTLLNLNRAGEVLLGGSIGNPLSRAAPDLAALIAKVRDHVLEGKGAYLPRGYEEALHVGPAWLLPRGSPVHTETGGLVGATVLLQDVTRLRRVDELKNDLVATVAHEVRTPLTSLRMAIDLSLEKAPTALLSGAREDCARLQATVDELLDLSRIQSGSLELERAPVPVRALVDEALAAHRAAAAERSVSLLAELEPVPEAITVDRPRFALVLANLVGNAIRYSPEGAPVVIGVSHANSRVRFEVRDRGPGIAAEHQKRIFEKFFRVPGTGTQGAGLGLAIAREIVEAHGGQIGVDSAPGQGARFWFTVPA